MNTDTGLFPFGIQFSMGNCPICVLSEALFHYINCLGFLFYLFFEKDVRRPVIISLNQSTMIWWFST